MVKFPNINRLNVNVLADYAKTWACVGAASLYIFCKYFLPKSLDYLLLIIILLLFSYRKKIKFSIKESHVPMVVSTLLFGVYLVLGTTWTRAPHTTFATSVLTFVTLLIGLAAMNQREFFRLLPKAIFVCSVLEAIGVFMPLISPSFYFAVLSHLPGDTYDNAVGFLSIGRLCGFNPQTAYPGFFMSIGIAVIFNELVFNKHKKGLRIVYWLSLLLEIVALILTFKRGPMLCVVVSAAVILIFNKKISIVSVVKYGLLVLVIGLVSVQFLRGIPEVNDSIEQSMERFEDQKGHDMTSGRGELNDRAFKFFENNPVLGIGYGTFSVDSPLGNHNVYMEILCECGLLGMIFYIPYLLVNLWKVVSSIRNKNGNLMLLNISLFIQLFYIVHSAVENCLTDNFVFLTYVLMTALPYAVENKKNLSVESGSYNLLPSC